MDGASASAALGLRTKRLQRSQLVLLLLLLLLLLLQPTCAAETHSGVPTAAGSAPL
jgi:hypothetical protein